jgi:DNA-binding response OmpR family regulator
MSGILVVSNDGIGLAHTLTTLQEAGYRASGASTFEEAKLFLAGESPDLVIADECLGAFNGLHVIMRARALRPDVSAIVTTRAKSRGLEADAKSLNVEWMVKPKNAADWLAPISRTLRVEHLIGPSSAHMFATSAVH